MGRRESGSDQSIWHSGNLGRDGEGRVFITNWSGFVQLSDSTPQQVLYLLNFSAFQIATLLKQLSLSWKLTQFSAGRNRNRVAGFCRNVSIKRMTGESWGTGCERNKKKDLLFIKNTDSAWGRGSTSLFLPLEQWWDMFASLLEIMFHCIIL